MRPLLDPDRLGRYDGLALGVRRGMGARPGERRVPGRPQPSGIELEAHAAYAPGDDLRHLDWNALGRLDTLLVRRFTAEREVVAHILLDTSASLGAPAADDKLGAACELAMGLAYVALRSGDAVRLAVLGDDATAIRAPVFRQRGSIPGVAEWLGALRSGGALAFAAAVEQYAARHPIPGVAFLISDFLLAPDEIERSVRALCARGYETHLLHILGPGELDPRREFTRATLADAESGARRAIALTDANLQRYQDALAAHLDALRGLADRNRATYVRLVAGTEVVTLLTGDLARAGVIRRR
jgi:uncharacterized protein (DUF58 family)